MKAAPIIRAIERHNATSGGPRIEHLLVHTGQHYDEAMSEHFFADLELPKPNAHLGVGSGSHGAQTAEILKKFEEVVSREWPSVVIVVGDVNSTLACALATVKLPVAHDRCRPRIAHVEAGLRSFDRTMPEEINRILTDHLSDLLFVTEDSGLRNLLHEGIPVEKIHFVGNTMIDSVLAFKDKADASDILVKLHLRKLAGELGTADGVARYTLLTLHRPSNVDDRETFLNILEGLKELGSTCPIVFPAHPRTGKRIAEFGLEYFFESENGNPGRDTSRTISAARGIHLVDPLGYLDFLCLMKHAALVVTDSGGIQEETTCLGIPCVTVRENTERPSTVDRGTNLMAGSEKEGIRRAIRRQLSRTKRGEMPEKWDGQAGERIIEILMRGIERRSAGEHGVVVAAHCDRN